MAHRYKAAGVKVKIRYDVDTHAVLGNAVRCDIRLRDPHARGLSAGRADLTLYTDELVLDGSWTLDGTETPDGTRDRVYPVKL